jgi:hypothetical protein
VAGPSLTARRDLIARLDPIGLWCLILPAAATTPSMSPTRVGRLLTTAMATIVRSGLATGTATTVRTVTVTGIGTATPTGIATGAGTGIGTVNGTTRALSGVPGKR